jgi:group I intron endonuclease
MIIYKATFPNKKCYIGQTVQKLHKRIYSHKNNSINKKSKQLINKAIRKYGWDNVVWSIIEDNINDVDLLNEREKFWIKELNTLAPSGYNLTTGGDGFIRAESTKRLMSKLLTNRKFTDEHKRNLSIAKIGKYNGKNNPNYGNHTPKLTKKQYKEHSKRMTGKNNPNYKHGNYTIKKVVL